jgi:hypothetical protein
MDAIFNEEMPPARLAILLEHFSQIDDDREPWRVVYPLAEVLLLLTCATIASCDDFEDIVAWGEQHLDFLRRFSEFHFGIPCVRWLQSLVNRVDPVLFGQCFESWIKELWPDRHDLIAIDGKTSRRTRDKRKGLKALHTLSAYASNARLVLRQLSVPEKTNEITAIPELLDHLAETSQLQGALVTIDAMGCQVAIATRSSNIRPVTCSPSKATSQPSKPRSLTTSVPLRRKRSSARPLLRRGMAASKHGPIQPRPRSTGPYPTEATRRAALHPHQDDPQGRFAYRIPRSIHNVRHPSLHLVGSPRYRLAQHTAVALFSPYSPSQRRQKQCPATPADE